MASQPGPLTQWPWHNLGNLKYAFLAPFVAQSTYKFFKMRNNGEEIDVFSLTIFPVFLLRLVHSQLWISLSRYKTAQGKHLIVDKSLDFTQVDRENNWDDQILLTAVLIYISNMVIPGAAYLPWWNTKGVVITIILHMGPVEFIYYWFHRALHHHFLYSRYHSHHHASIVTQPITCTVIHPFGEEMVYFMLFAIPMLSMAITGTACIIAVTGYLLYIDFMNYMGHCNFELVPQSLFHLFPPLKYLMYTPSFHSLHHTQFRTNYSLFMPFYDYIYGTTDKSSDDLYERSLSGKEVVAPRVIHLTHLTGLQSIYHLRFGFASLASAPFAPISKWCSWVLWPFTFTISMMLTKFYGSSLTLERNKLKKLHLETWLIPRHSFQYMSSTGKVRINDMIERTISKAESMGVKVMSLGLLNQGEELNGNGEYYVHKNPKLKVRIVDGTGLAVAVVLNTVPPETERVIFRGNLSKMAYQLVLAFCQREIKVGLIEENEYENLKQKIPQEMRNNLTLLSNSTYSSTEVWIVGDGLKDEEQYKAQEGSHFIPFSQFPPKQKRKDCIYHTTPAMLVPKTYENVHTCENWLPRRVMSAWRVAGIVHALEGWDTHECGINISTDVDKVWRAALSHGFLPFQQQTIQ